MAGEGQDYSSCTHKRLGRGGLLSNAEDRSACPASWLFTSLLPAKALSKHTRADLSLPALQKSGKICATVPPIHAIAQAMQCIEKPSLILRGLLLVARPVRLTHLCLAIIR